MIKTLKEVEKQEQVFINNIGGYDNLTEFYRDTYNEIQRDLIKTFKKEKGECYIYNINYNNIVRSYEGGKIYNFDGSFILDTNDKEIVELITKNRKNCNMKSIDKIFKLVELKNGIILRWI